MRVRGQQARETLRQTFRHRSTGWVTTRTTHHRRAVTPSAPRSRSAAAARCSGTTASTAWCWPTVPSSTPPPGRIRPQRSPTRVPLSSPSRTSRRESIAAAVAKLHDDGHADVALVGGSAGADAILQLASQQPDLPDQLVLLSPNRVVDGLGGEPTLFIASEDEPVAHVSQQLADSSPGVDNERSFCRAPPTRRTSSTARAVTRHYKRSSSGWPTEDLPAGQPPTLDLDQRSLRPLTGESRVDVKPKTVVVSLPIVDLDRSLRFYRDGLGLSPTGLDEAILAFEPRDSAAFGRARRAEPGARSRQTACGDCAVRPVTAPRSCMSRSPRSRPWPISG